MLAVSAGVYEFGTLGEIIGEHFDKTFNTDVRGLLFTVQKEPSGCAKAIVSSRDTSNMRRPGGTGPRAAQLTGKAITKALLGHRIFVDRAVLHDDQKVFVGIFEELDVLQRIAVDQQQICQCALFHDAKLARIGVDKSRQRHQLAIVRGGHLERFGRGVPADQLGQYRPLPAGNPRIEKNVAAKKLS